MAEPERPPARNPWAFVPALYFLQGIPYFLVETASTVFLSAVSLPLSQIGHASSALTLPWTLKPLWSPLVDLVATKRLWVLATQTAIVAAIGALAFAVTSSHAVLWTIVACATLALSSATHDIAADGFYILALDRDTQAAFVGVRNAAFRLARVFVTGSIVYAAGTLEKRGHSVPTAWGIAFAAAAAVYAAGFLVCLVALPRPAADRTEGGGAAAPFRAALASYFDQPRIGAVLAFILLYRFGESMLTKMSPPFLMAPAARGGMGLATDEVGLLWGTAGVVALIAGGILGGLAIARYGLKRCLWPMALSMHVPNAFYAWAAFEHPGRAALCVVVAVEQLAYGFGFSAYMVFLMLVSRRGRYPTTHYAISTGFMGVGAMAAGYVSGDLAEALGFGWFFVVVCACAIPGLVPLFFVPLDEGSARAPQ